MLSSQNHSNLNHAGLGVKRSLAHRQEEVIAELVAVHGQSYNYDNVKIHSYSQRIELHCEEHGDFSLLLLSHRKGSGCPYCSGVLKTNAQWEDGFRKTHGNTFEYKFLSKQTKSVDQVEIKCLAHGAFALKVMAHARGQGCPDCSKEQKKKKSKLAKSWRDVQAEMTKLHKAKYDYSGIEFEKFDQVLSLNCKTHGAFSVSLISHRGGSGCPYCVGKAKTNADWMADFKEVHGNDYSYIFLSESTKSRDKVEITCKENHTFMQTVNNHKKGQGCPVCAKDVRRDTARNTFERKLYAKINGKPRRSCFAVRV